MDEKMFVSNARHGNGVWISVSVNAKNVGHAAKKLRKKARILLNLEAGSYIELDEILEVVEDMPKLCRAAGRPHPQLQFNLF